VNPLRTKIFLNGIYRFKALAMVCSTWVRSSFFGTCPSPYRFEYMAFIVVSMVLICGVFQVLLLVSHGCFFLQHFSVITRGRVLFSGAYLL
jgi:hypothetical protein